MTKKYSIYEDLVQDIDKYEVYDLSGDLLNTFDNESEAIAFAVEQDGDYVDLYQAGNTEPERIWERGYDDWEKCEWCDEYFPTSDLSKTNVGKLCDHCYLAVSSREPITKYPRGAYDDTITDYFMDAGADDLNEQFLSREQIISELRKLGYNYKFDKYTDAQLFRILGERRNAAEKAKKAKEQADRARAAEEAKQGVQLKLDDFINNKLDDNINVGESFSINEKAKKKKANKMGYFTKFCRDPEKEVEIFNHLTKFNDKFKADSNQASADSADSGASSGDAGAASGGGAE